MSARFVGKLSPDHGCFRGIFEHIQVGFFCFCFFHLLEGVLPCELHWMTLNRPPNFLNQIPFHYHSSNLLAVHVHVGLLGQEFSGHNKIDLVWKKSLQWCKAAATSAVSLFYAQTSWLVMSWLSKSGSHGWRQSSEPPVLSKLTHLVEPLWYGLDVKHTHSPHS